MKTIFYVLGPLVAAVLTATSVAEDSSAGCKCEMMKKHESVSAPQIQAIDAQAELNQLVLEMNTNTGSKKLEAMAAIITRLVEQWNAKATVPAQSTPSDPAHHH